MHLGGIQLLPNLQGPRMNNRGFICSLATDTSEGYAGVLLTCTAGLFEYTKAEGGLEQTATVRQPTIPAAALVFSLSMGRMVRASSSTTPSPENHYVRLGSANPGGEESKQRTIQTGGSEFIAPYSSMSLQVKRGIESPLGCISSPLRPTNRTMLSIAAMSTVSNGDRRRLLRLTLPQKPGGQSRRSSGSLALLSGKT